MEGLNYFLKKLKEEKGIEVDESSLKGENYVRLQCDGYNSTTGKRNELDGYDCKQCKNRGNFAKPMQSGTIWVEQLVPCSCMPTRNTILKLKKSGLKNIITDYKFDKYIVTEEWQRAIKESAMNYAKNPDNSWFFLGGASGCGKTHLCTAIAGCFLRAGKNVRYMLWRDDITKLKNCITDADTYDDLMQSYKTAEVLYIDDLFKNGKGADGKVSQPTTSDINIAFELLNYRYNNKHLVTIISSERLITDLIEIDEATAGRIAEMSFDKGYCININPDKKKNYRIRGITSI